MKKAEQMLERIIQDLKQKQQPQEESMLALMTRQLGDDTAAESMAKEILRESKER